MLTFDDVLAARERIRGVAKQTPVLTSRQFNQQAGCEVFFKAENLQRVGAFKFRGAFNKLSSLTPAEREQGVLAFSSGNHAQAVALSAQLLNIRATIVMPSDAPSIKVTATRGYGAEIVFYDRYNEDREQVGRALIEEHGYVLVPPYDDYYVMAGQGTATLELLEEVGDLDALVVCASGCGLLAGSATVARHLQPEIRIYGVEPEAGNDSYLSFREGKRVEIPVPRTIADGLQQTSPGKLTFPIVQKLVNDFLLVSDSQLVETMLFMLERMKVLAEPSGAAGAAAVRHRKADFAGKRVGVIISGGNVDLERLAGYVLAA